jgi:hypothetical protein
MDQRRGPALGGPRQCPNPVGRSGSLIGVLECLVVEWVGGVEGQPGKAAAG